jgi:putative DNA primase/helicase
LTLLVGDPGLGKSLVTLSITSTVSRGQSWPDAPHHPQLAGGVILLNAEDDLADTIRPRLDAHEANAARVLSLTSLADLAHDIDWLADAIDRVDGCRLVVVDPISAYMGRVNTHCNAEVRALLAPLSTLAAEKRIAVLAVTHLRKGEGAAMYRAMGSLAFVAASRAAWVVVRDKHDARRRLMLAVKNNLAADVSTGLAFTIERHDKRDAPLVCWERNPVTISADEALAPEPKRRGPSPAEREGAKQFLSGILADGPREAKEVIAEGIECGLSKRTIQRAFEDIDGHREKHGFAEGWVWSLPVDANNNGRKKLGTFEKTCHLRTKYEQNSRREHASESDDAEDAKFTGTSLQPWTSGHTEDLG